MFEKETTAAAWHPPGIASSVSCERDDTRETWRNRRRRHFVDGQRHRAQVSAWRENCDTREHTAAREISRVVRGNNSGRLLDFSHDASSLFEHFFG